MDHTLLFESCEYVGDIKNAITKGLLTMATGQPIMIYFLIIKMARVRLDLSS